MGKEAPLIDWQSVAKRLGYDSPTRMWEDLYLEKKLSISQIETKLDVSRNVVKEQLTKAGIASRSRGGPNNAKVVITDELIAEMKRDGIKAVASRLQLSYTTLYKRLRLRGISATSLRLPVSEAAETDVVEDVSSTGEGDGEGGDRDSGDLE